MNNSSCTTIISKYITRRRLNYCSLLCCNLEVANETKVELFYCIKIIIERPVFVLIMTEDYEG